MEEAEPASIEDRSSEIAFTDDEPPPWRLPLLQTP